MIKQSGLSLIEVIIVVAIIALMLFFALPNFQSYIMKSRRSAATTTLENIHMAQIKYRGNNLTYGTIAQVWNNQTATEGGFYTLSISNITGSTFTITATPVNGQEQDSQGQVSCNPMTLSVSSLTVTKTPEACWLR